MSSPYPTAADLLDAATIELEELQSLPPISLDIDGAVAFTLLAQLQLALRHPANDRAAAAIARTVAQEIEHCLAPTGPALAELIRRGWDPDHDQVPDHLAGQAELDDPSDPAQIGDGVYLIAAERHRQLTEEGFTFEHDDVTNNDEQLASAAAFYATPERYGQMTVFWPWGNPHKKRQHTRLRQLVVAGALLAAEIDRILRTGDPTYGDLDTALPPATHHHQDDEEADHD